jgi:Flp pilus assembly protein TadD
LSFSPVAGTFKLFLQDDGSFHEEDSHERYLPVRDAAGSFAGIADPSAIVSAAITAATEDRADRAGDLMAMVEGDESVTVGVGSAVVDLLAGRGASAERALRDLAGRDNPETVQAVVNSVGFGLLQIQNAEKALGVFQVGTRVFPDGFRTWHGLGQTHMRLGHDDEAVRAFERSLELNPGNSNAKAMIARIRGGGLPPTQPGPREREL